ncbi:acetyl-CoA C-acetyltransferase [Mycobacterium koreense]|uniref:Acetyl-CoA acetyltransferase n=1 Tax=Mycolicibacillus koreensis TaxID=1069220 RepID=A0A7I7SF77_9MYCO|nr:acetyl-CoA C-acetyltransferase [Mycolicibacillus koreensis]MCV7248630.1 acetyl-CoA C-acetyltransferase [Mycolicibacillus koreensis]ODR11866.1 acetyl-CoA acetyltransferase [Mycolicibacillus koreensis]OSC34014.1 acetyl-CoA acetyltransferase [Mycolicibacillus koreensis]BBY55592.1 acetyl-CoA acetyltransferase [Mycolicibacillus koreensis]
MASANASDASDSANTARRRVAVLGGNRIPFARSDGAYAEASNQDMFTAVLNGLADRFNLAGERLDAVVGGAVLKHSRDFNLMRESVLGSTLSSYTPAFDIQQACGTGLQAAICAADGIAAGRYEVAAAGGVDTTSDAPLEVGNELRRTLLALRRAKTNLARLKLVAKLPATLGVEIPANQEVRTGLSMGEHQAITTKQMGITRVDQDELAAASHRNMAAAYDRGFFDDLVSPFLGLYRDNNLRADSSAEKLAKLRPVFGVKSGDATMTAGNSTPLTDGASVALLASEDWAKAHKLTPLAYFVDAETAAVDYVNGVDGLLMAPTYAVPRLLARNGLALQDFDFYEIHEAFASTVLCHLQAWESEQYCTERLGLDAALGAIDRSKLNVNGSSLAAGHPFAATGGRILAQTAKQLAEAKAARKGSAKKGAAKNTPIRALISICAAGGQGVAAILEA